MRSTQTGRPSLRGVWTALGVPPLAFLVVIVAASVIVGASGEKDPDAIASAVGDATPWLLLVVQGVLLAVSAVALRRSGRTWRDLAWRPPAGRSRRGEAAIGVGAGVTLAVAYLAALSPLQVWMQRTVGDYVPAGELFPSLGANLGAFFVANVVLAPFAEECLYRGYALPRLQARYRTSVAIALNCLCFGLLHWTGGLWYVLLTGIVAGGMLAGLYTWRRNLTVAYAAHLALNTVEFGYIAWTVST